MNPLWPLYLSFITFLSGTIALSSLAVYFGYFATPSKDVTPLAIGAFISALIAGSIGDSIAKMVRGKKE